MDINNDTNLVGFNLANEIKEDITNYDIIFKVELNNLYPNKISCKCIKLEVSEVCTNK